MNIQTRETMALTEEQAIKLTAAGYTTESHDGKEFIMLPDKVFRRETKFGATPKQIKARRKGRL